MHGRFRRPHHCRIQPLRLNSERINYSFVSPCLIHISASVTNNIQYMHVYLEKKKGLGGGVCVWRPGWDWVRCACVHAWGAGVRMCACACVLWHLGKYY